MKKTIAILTIAISALLFNVMAQTTQPKKPATTSAKPAQTKTNPAKPVEAYQVTFVELGSVNCIPCKQMQPIMKEIEKEYAGKVKVVFHDVWTEQGRKDGEKFNIRVIPTQVFLGKDGKEYFRHEGFFPKEELVKVLKQKLK